VLLTQTLLHLHEAALFRIPDPESHLWATYRLRQRARFSAQWGPQPPTTVPICAAVLRMPRHRIVPPADRTDPKKPLSAWLTEEATHTTTNTAAEILTRTTTDTAVTQLMQAGLRLFGMSQPGETHALRTLPTTRSRLLNPASRKISKISPCTKFIFGPTATHLRLHSIPSQSGAAFFLSHAQRFLSQNSTIRFFSFSLARRLGEAIHHVLLKSNFLLDITCWLSTRIFLCPCTYGSSNRRLGLGA
jgi:hypothetical protein